MEHAPMTPPSPRFIGMPDTPDKSHALAAEAHEHTARAHRLAAQSHEKGDWAAAIALAGCAETQARSARELSRNAHWRSCGSLSPVWASGIAHADYHYSCGNPA